MYSTIKEKHFEPKRIIGSIGYARGDFHHVNTIEYQQHIPKPNNLVTSNIDDLIAQKHDDALSSDDDIYYSDDEMYEAAAAGINPVMMSSVDNVDLSSRRKFN